MPPFRAVLCLVGANILAGRSVLNHVMPGRALGANPESRSRMILLDSGFLREGADAPE